jgi:hypothetical protein
MQERDSRRAQWRTTSKSQLQELQLFLAWLSCILQIFAALEAFCDILPEGAVCDHQREREREMSRIARSNAVCLWAAAALQWCGGSCSAQEILITGRDILIPAGSITTDKFAGTDFGQAMADSSRQSPIKIHNLDPDNPLNITLVSITGSHPTDFVVFSGGSTPIDETRSMSLIFEPTDTGIRTATVNFGSDDPSLPTYSFAVRGEALEVLGLAVPELELQLIKGPKHNCDGSHDPCRVSGKIAVWNTQFVGMEAGTIRIFGTNSEFFDSGAVVLLTELPLKRIKPGKTRKVRFKASFGSTVPFERIFIRVESTSPTGIEQSYGDNQVVGIVPIL